MNKPLWKLTDVTLEGRDQPRLKNLSLELQAGVTAVIGPSGAGKSSFLNLLVGFERPARGQLSSHLPAAMDLPLFWVPQNGGLWPHLTICEHLLAVCPDPHRHESLLRQFDLDALSAAYPDTLSAGERARLSLARGLASGAGVLVMDEPLANVDQRRRRAYWQVIRAEFSGEHSLVFATHSVDTVMREADHVICLEQGQVMYAGDKQTLYEEPATGTLAELLGPANWFEEVAEARDWLQATSEQKQCYRPEQLQVAKDEASPLQITCARYGTTIGELDVENTETRHQRTFFHRQMGHRFQAGDRVILRVVAMLLCCLCLFTGLVGCTHSSTDSAMTVAAVHHWSIPPAGKVIPAPRSVRFSGDGEVYVLDNAGRVLVYAADSGEVLRQWEMPAYDVGKPEGICVFHDGRIAVTDTHYHRVVFFDRQGNVLGMHGERGREPGQFIYPVAITQDDAENYYICEYGDNDRVQKFSVDGTWQLEFGTFGTAPGQFQRPSGIVWDNHRIYVADAINNRIQVFSDAGTFTDVLEFDGVPPALHYPYDMIAGQDDQLFVVEYGAGRVTELSKTGRVLSRWGSVGASKGQLTTPWGLAMDTEGNLIVADTGNRRLVEILR